MTYRTPFLEVLGPTGNDLVRIAGSDLIGVKIVDRADDVSDEATIVFTRKKPYLAAPALGTPFTIRLGWHPDEAALVGQFTFQNMHFSGQPSRGQTVEWVCRAADFLGNIKDVDSRHFDKENGHTTLGDVFRSLFAGQQVLMDPSLSETPIPGGYNLQWRESNIDHATDLAHENGLIIKPSMGKIIVMKRGAGLSAGGQQLKTVVVPFDLNYEFDVELEPRFEYQSVTSSWFDTDLGRLQSTDQLTAYKSGKDALPHPYQTKEEAKASAEARARDWQNFAGRGSFDMPGNPAAVAMCPVQCVGFGSPIDNVSWEAVTVTHDVGEQGWITTIETQVSADDPLDAGTILV